MANCICAVPRFLRSFGQVIVVDHRIRADGGSTRHLGLQTYLSGPADPTAARPTFWRTRVLSARVIFWSRIAQKVGDTVPYAVGLFQFQMS